MVTLFSLIVTTDTSLLEYVKAPGLFEVGAFNENTAFPNVCLNVQVTVYDSTNSGISNGTAVVSGISNTGFSVTLTSSPIVDGFMWTAYGN
jgi:hypothetical protein